MKIIDSIWFTFGRNCMGFVLVENPTGKKKVYLGRESGIDQKADEKMIASFGSRVHPGPMIEFLKRGLHDTDGPGICETHGVPGCKAPCCVVDLKTSIEGDIKRPQPSDSLVEAARRLVGRFEHLAPLIKAEEDSDDPFHRVAADFYSTIEDALSQIPTPEGDKRRGVVRGQAIPRYSEAVDVHIYCDAGLGCKTQEDWKLLALAALDQGNVPEPIIDAVAKTLEMRYHQVITAYENPTKSKEIG